MASTNYEPPSWAGKPGPGLHLDVLKVIVWLDFYTTIFYVRSGVYTCEDTTAYCLYVNGVLLRPHIMSIRTVNVSVLMFFKHLDKGKLILMPWFVYIIHTPSSGYYLLQFTKRISNLSACLCLDDFFFHALHALHQSKMRFMYTYYL